MREINLKYNRIGDGIRFQHEEEELIGVNITPLPVEYEDLDETFFKFCQENITIIDDEEKEVPTFKLYSNQRFSEYSQTWEHTDEDGNLLMNFKTISRETNPQFGNIHNSLANIPVRHRFTVRIREIVDKNGVECYEYTTMSQPLPVDMKYKLSFVTSKMERLNSFNLQLIELFQSKQCYISINGHYMPLILESLDDETNYTIEERKFFTQSANIKLMGYVIPKDDIKVTLYPKKLILDTEPKVMKNNVILDYVDDDSNNIILTIDFIKNPSKITFIADDDMKIQIDTKENVGKTSIFINGNIYDPEHTISIKKSDEITIKVQRIHKNKKGTIIFIGEIIE